LVPATCNEAEGKDSKLMGRDATFRRKAATVLVALYAFCVLAPHAAMALTHGGNAAHCLTEAANAPHQHSANTSHVHDDGMMHEHGQRQSAKPQNSDSDPADAPAACCGLFFMTALVAESYPVAVHETPAGKIAAVAQDSRADHPPGCLHRPPIL
jgi:hypothetical protein